MSHLGIRDDGPGQPPWCRGNATAVPATSKTAIAAGTVVLNRPPITRGTEGSNPSPSSGESTANLTSSIRASSFVAASRERMVEPPSRQQPWAETTETIATRFLLKDYLGNTLISLVPHRALRPSPCQ